MNITEGQEAEQAKRIAKVSAAVKGSIVSNMSTFEAKKRAVVQTPC